MTFRLESPWLLSLLLLIPILAVLPMLARRRWRPAALRYADTSLAKQTIHGLRLYLRPLLPVLRLAAFNERNHLGERHPAAFAKPVRELSRLYRSVLSLTGVSESHAQDLEDQGPTHKRDSGSVFADRVRARSLRCRAGKDS